MAFIVKLKSSGYLAQCVLSVRFFPSTSKGLPSSAAIALESVSSEPGPNSLSFPSEVQASMPP